MKPAPFRYVRPSSVDEAIAVLAAEGYGAKPLAGGQSLIPAMNFRLAQPAVLVDLGLLDELRGIRENGSGLYIGAMTPHSDIEPDTPSIASTQKTALRSMSATMPAAHLIWCQKLNLSLFSILTGTVSLT